MLPLERRFSTNLRRRRFGESAAVVGGHRRLSVPQRRLRVFDAELVANAGCRRVPELMRNERCHLRPFAGQLQNSREHVSTGREDSLGGRSVSVAGGQDGLRLGRR